MNRFTIELHHQDGQPGPQAGRQPGRPQRSGLEDAISRSGGALAQLASELEISNKERDELLAAHLPLCRLIGARRRALGRPLVVGVSGSQGSGKTTFCRFAQILLERLFGYRVCGLSIDDLYLGIEDRRRLASEVHPLFATRGVPGTHDVPLALDLLRRLRDPETTGEICIPAFDKAIDDRLPENRWPVCSTPVDVIIFEGWCVAAQAQTEDALKSPLNGLEAEEDPDASWRRRVNDALRGPYAELFAEIDLLVFLAVPGWDAARQWRGLQEAKLARSRPDSPALMDEQALERFLMFYERITRHALETLSEQADVVCRIDDSHRITHLLSKAPWPKEPWPKES